MWEREQKRSQRRTKLGMGLCVREENLSSAGRSWTVTEPCFIFSRTLGGLVAMRPGRRLKILSRNDDELN